MVFFSLSSIHQFLQMGEGDGGAVEEHGVQPALLITAVADGSAWTKKRGRNDKSISSELFLKS